MTDILTITCTSANGQRVDTLVVILVNVHKKPTYIFKLGKAMHI